MCLKFLTSKRLEGLEAYLLCILDKLKQKLRVDLVVARRTNKVDPLGAMKVARNMHLNHRTLLCSYIIELKLSNLEEAEQVLQQTQFKQSLNTTLADDPTANDNEI